MNRYICSRCLSELDTEDEALAPSSDLPKFTVLGGVGGLLGSLATGNPLVMVAALAGGVAGDAACFVCGSQEDLHLVEQEGGEETDMDMLPLEPRPPLHREALEDTAGASGDEDLGPAACDYPSIFEGEDVGRNAMLGQPDAAPAASVEGPGGLSQNASTPPGASAGIAGTGTPSQGGAGAGGGAASGGGAGGTAAGT